MKTTSPHPFPKKLLALGAGVSLFAATASVATAQLVAYEGFDNPSIVPGIAWPDGTALNSIPATGFGFSGNWTVSNGNSNTSIYQASGLSYPASYPGTFVAVGGNGLNKGNTANSMLRLNLEAAAAATLNSATEIYVSFLGERQGAETAGFANPYPRNAGARFNNSATPNNNGSLGLIGGNGNNAENNGWGAWGWKDTHGLMTTPLADMAGGVDFVVGRFDLASSKVTFWVNPQMYGSSDGKLSFTYTDGGNPLPIAIHAFGVEAGSASGGREAGEWVFDEIRYGLDFASVAGFEMIPEPSLIGFLGFGLIATLLGFRRRR
jgi:hypothetical protein